MDSTSEPIIPREPLKRVATGVPGLDQLLHGGLLRGGLYVVLGSPGTGKTILGNQISFHLAGLGEKTVFVTLLAESHGRMLAHLETMEFFRPELVSQFIYYVSGYRIVREEGLKAFLDFVAEIVQQQQAKFLVLDGISTVRAVATSDVEYEEFLHALHIQLGLLNCTGLLISGQSPDEVHSEHAMVDGVFALYNQPVGSRAVRQLEVQKFRGSDHLRGKHTFDISDAGIRVYPRFEAIYADPPKRNVNPNDRKRLAISGLDDMLGGGFIANSTTMLLGSPGIGKTTVGLYFLLAGAQEGESGLYFGFSETPDRLVQKSQLMGVDIEPDVRSGRIFLETRLSSETHPDALAHNLVELIQRHQIKRLVLDGIEPFSQTAEDPNRKTRFISALLSKLLDLGVTSLVTEQTNVLFGPNVESPLIEVQAIIDNVLFMRFIELHSSLRRMISILKMRESNNDRFVREFTMSPRGIAIMDPFDDVEAVLTGLPRPLVKEERRAKRPLRKLAKRLGGGKPKPSKPTGRRR